jgi:hypothetical protein
MKVTKLIGARVKTLGCMVALMGSLFCFSPVTAFAGGPDCICDEKCTEDHINPDCPICSEDYHNCEGKDPVIEEKWGPLTPDGNMELVDDYGSLEAGGKQFITVMTKNGNYFYIIIDRDDEGEEKVHFLNMVDEADLLSLMDEDQVSEYIAVTGKGKEKEEEPKEVVTVPEPEPAPEPVVEPEPEKEPVNVNGIMAIILVIGLAAAGGFMYYTSTKNSKKKNTGVDPDQDYTDQDYLDSIGGDDEYAYPEEDESENESSDEEGDE